jgi:hypothetical protein
MMPPELLHTSGSGLIMYMFELLRVQMGGGMIETPLSTTYSNVKLDKEAK